MVLPFLKCVAKVLLKAGINAVTLGLGGDLLNDLWEEWSRQTDAEQRRKELENLAQMGQQQATQQAATAVAQQAPNAPSEVQQVLTTYLAQVPAQIRRSLRRPTDPTGTTLTPDLAPKRAEDLKPLLPERLPRFKPGDRPLPGVPWVLQEQLGLGGFGEVWKAYNPDVPGLCVALKFCLDEEARERLLHHEAKVVAQVQQQGKHPGIVELRQFYRHADAPCLEYEFIDGQELNEWVQSRTLNPNQVNRLILQLAEIVASAHRLNPAVVHRDLKPANILVAFGSGTEPKLKVADFGIGGLVKGTTLNLNTSRPTMLANAYTQLYASPEQKRGSPPHPTDDVYALGVLWYQLLTGNLVAEPPTGVSWRKHLSNRGIGEKILDLVQSCIEHECQQRPLNARCLAQDLAELMEKPFNQKSETRYSPIPPASREKPNPAGQHTVYHTPSSQEVVTHKPSLPEVVFHKPSPPEVVFHDVPRLPVVRPTEPPSEKYPEPQQDEEDILEPSEVNEPSPSPRPKLGAALVAVTLIFGIMAVISIFVFLDIFSPAPPRKPKSSGKMAFINPAPDKAFSGPKAGDIYTNQQGMKFVFVPEGSFWMSKDGKNAQTYKGIPHDYYIGAYEVTQEQWLALMGNNPSWFSREGKGWESVKDISEDDLRQYPVETVSWDDVQKFLQKLNALAKKADWVYRLPTEEEWEFACRGGVGGKEECNFDYYFQTPTNLLTINMANFNKYRNGPMRVNSTQPNKLGIYNMHGNVWEWCQDLFDSSCGVVRGGSWESNASSCRAGMRILFTQDHPKGKDLGLRLVLVPAGN